MSVVRRNGLLAAYVEVFGDLWILIHLLQDYGKGSSEQVGVYCKGDIAAVPRANLSSGSGGKMRLELVRYKCATCGNVYTAPSLGESVYGEFLLWSESGDAAYLNAFEDPTFKEVEKLLQSHPSASTLLPLDRAKVLRKIYGSLACDTDEHGLPFSIEALPPCPSCGGQKSESWELTNPVEVVDIPLKRVTHTYWYALSKEEKRAQLSVSLSTDVR